MTRGGTSSPRSISACVTATMRLSEDGSRSPVPTGPNGTSLQQRNSTRLETSWRLWSPEEGLMGECVAASLVPAFTRAWPWIPQDAHGGLFSATAYRSKVSEQTAV